MRDWLARFISTMDGGDLDLLTLWSVHIHLAEETYTTPRLLLDSPVPESGKTTTLEHLNRLCFRPMQAASLSSPAMLCRALDAGLRTFLIDEVDRSLRPDKEGVQDLVAILNSGYKRGATRPVLVPVKGGGWVVEEMPTFAPVAMAGNNPDLPGDTMSRTVRVLLMPGDDVSESDWELIEGEAADLAARLAAWADSVRAYVRTTRPELPPGVVARARERWAPLKRVAVAAGGRWPEVVDALALRDVERLKVEREDDLVQQKPAIVLLRHIADVWPEGEAFVPTDHLIDRLVGAHPDMWSERSPFGKRLTAQRLGRMLVKSYNIHSDRPHTQRPRGYLLSTLSPAFRRFDLTPTTLSDKPDKPAVAATPDTRPGQEPLPHATDIPTPPSGGRVCPECHEPVAAGQVRHPACMRAAARPGDVHPTCEEVA